MMAAARPCISCDRGPGTSWLTMWGTFLRSTLAHSIETPVYVVVLIGPFSPSTLSVGPSGGIALPRKPQRHPGLQAATAACIMAVLPLEGRTKQSQNSNIIIVTRFMSTPFRRRGGGTPLPESLQAPPSLGRIAPRTALLRFEAHTSLTSASNASAVSTRSTSATMKSRVGSRVSHNTCTSAEEFVQAAVQQRPDLDGLTCILHLAEQAGPLG